MKPKYFVLTDEDLKRILALQLVQEINPLELTTQERLLLRMAEEIRQLQEGYK